MKQLWNSSAKITSPSRNIAGLMLVALVGLVIGLAWFLTLTQLNADKSQVINAKYQSLGDFNELIASQIEAKLQHIAFFLDLANGWLLSNPDVDPRLDPLFARAVDLWKSRMDKQVDIRFVSTDNKLYYLGDPPGQPRADVADREYVIAQQNHLTRGLHIGNAVKSRVTGVWGIPISLPLNPNDQGLSLIFAALELPILMDAWETSLPGTSSYINLLKLDGTIIANAPFNEDRQGMSVIQGELWTKLLPQQSQGTGRIEKGIIDGQSRFITWKTLDQYPLVVTTSISEDEVLAAWAKQSNLSLILVTIMTLLVLILSLRVWSLLQLSHNQVLKLQELAQTDGLTGLSNRRHWLEHAGVEFAKAQRYQRPCACLLLDLDHFKTYNDTLGHSMGDSIIKEFASILANNLRTGDLIARYGGEEFIALLPETELNQALVLAERIRLAATAYQTPQGILTVSIGVAELHASMETLDTLINRADSAMYKAKEGGRNMVATLDPLPALG